MKKIIDNWKLRRVTKRNLKNEEDEINQFIADLKSLDQGIIYTMGQLCRKLNISIPESRELVINSPSWIDKKENFIEFNNQFMDVLEKEADNVEEHSDGTVSLTFNLIDKKDK
jgi:hypothetical protein